MPLRRILRGRLSPAVGNTARLLHTRMHSLRCSFWSLQSSMFSTWPFSALAGTGEHAQPFYPGKGIRIGRPTGFPGSGRMTIRCVLVMLSQDPRGVPNHPSEDGSRWPRRNGGMVAYEHPESDLNTGLARTVPLGGGVRQISGWLPARFYQSAPAGRNCSHVSC